MNATAEVVIAGGGFAGLAVGISLVRAGIPAVVLDGGGTTAFRGELLHPRGVRTLANLGLSGALEAAGAVEVRGFAAFEPGKADPVLLPYPGDRGAGFEHEAFLRELRALAESVRLRRVPAKADAVLVEGGRVVGLRTREGDTHRAQLVVVADGRHSRLRGQLGIPTRSELLSFTLAPALEGDLLPQSDMGHVFVGAPGPVLAYPYGARRVRMCIDVPIGATGDRASLAAYVTRCYRPFLPARLGEAMVAAVQSGGYRSSANHAVATDACAVPGAALVGDAGGCSHPLTAAGMMLALHDASTLLEALREEGVGDAALLAYQRRRYAFVRARESFAQALFEILRGEGPGAESMRRGVFRYWRSDPRAKRVSTGILAGEESRTSAFLAEYGRVGISAGLVLGLGGHQGAPGPMGTLAPLGSMLRLAGGCLQAVTKKSWSAARLRRTRSLVRAPVTIPRPGGGSTPSRGQTPLAY